MNWRRVRSVSLLCGLILTGSHDGAMAQQMAPPAAPDVTLTYWGTAGWEITDGEVVILVDPYLSRLRIEQKTPLPDTPADLRPIFGINDPLRSDTAAIDAHVRRAAVLPDLLASASLFDPRDTEHSLRAQAETLLRFSDDPARCAGSASPPKLRRGWQPGVSDSLERSRDPDLRRDELHRKRN